MIIIRRRLRFRFFAFFRRQRALDVSTLFAAAFADYDDARYYAATITIFSHTFSMAGWPIFFITILLMMLPPLFFALRHAFATQRVIAFVSHADIFAADKLRCRHDTLLLILRLLPPCRYATAPFDID